MTKRDKALIELLGMLTTELTVIAANLAFHNAANINVGARKSEMFRGISRVMQENVDKIESIVKEATNDK